MKPTETTYAQMGMAAILPGMVRVLEIVQREVDSLRAQLSELQNGPPPPRRGRPPKAIGAPVVHVGQGQPFGGAETHCPYCHEAVGMKAMHLHVKAYHPKQLAKWQAMPKLAKYSLTEPSPRPASNGWSDDPEERKREMKRRLKMRKNGAARWASMTKAQQKSHLAKMAAGKVKTNGALEAPAS